jgi:hypothetical protein
MDKASPGTTQSARPSETQKPIRSAGELWPALVKSAGLDLKLYDQQLLDELAMTLDVPADDFAAALDRKGISIEELIKSFISVVAPYAGMMRDILASFTRASARSSNENLRIQFDFQKASEQFDLDLSNFRDWERRLEAAVSRVEVYNIGELAAYELRHAFVAAGVTYRIERGRWIDIEPEDDQVREWLDESASGPASVSTLPPPPPVAEEELRVLLSRVWGLLRALLSAGLLNAADVRTIVRGAYLLAPTDGDLTSRLREFFMHIPTPHIERLQVLLERLEEILSLPVWKRREELYSVWVGTRLIDALGEDGYVHQVGRSILFSTRGSHLATRHLSRFANVHVWAELRTPLADPLGKSRRASIKPDYVLSSEPLTHPSSSLLVVECKQYLHQNKRNFSEALIDYARGHPNAEVVLVNYGPTTTTVLERVVEVAPEVGERAHVIEKFRPGNPDALEEFRRYVEAAISAQDLAARRAQGQKTRHPATPDGSVTLIWGDSPEDLDLHCWLAEPTGNSAHVYYGNQSYETDSYRLQLDADVQDGDGPETLRWSAQGDIALVFAVHNFSDQRPIAGCGARVEASVADFRFEFEVPPGGAGRWWHLFAFDSSSGVFQLKNITADEPPEPDE